MQILLVEADESLGRVLSESLADEGYAVARVATDAEALRRLAAASCDVLIADAGRVMTGRYGPAERAAAAALARHAPVILATAQPWAERATAAQLGVAAVLPKPFDLDALSAALGLVERGVTPPPRSTPLGSRIGHAFALSCVAMLLWVGATYARDAAPAPAYGRELGATRARVLPGAGGSVDPAVSPVSAAASALLLALGSAGIAAGLAIATGVVRLRPEALPQHTEPGLPRGAGGADQGRGPCAVRPRSRPRQIGVGGR